MVFVFLFLSVLYNAEHMLVTLQKRKAREGLSRSPQKTKKKEAEKEKLKAPTIPPWSPMIGLEALWASRVAARYNDASIRDLTFCLYWSIRLDDTWLDLVKAHEIEYGCVTL